MGEGGGARAVFVPVVRHTQVWLSANGTITSQAGGVRPPEQEQTEPGPRVSKSARAQGTAEGSWQGGSAGDRGKAAGLPVGTGRAVGWEGGEHEAAFVILGPYL